MSHRNLSQYVPTTSSLLQLPCWLSHKNYDRTGSHLGHTRGSFMLSLESRTCHFSLSSLSVISPLVFVFSYLEYQTQFSFPHLPICPVSPTLQSKYRLERVKPLVTPSYLEAKIKAAIPPARPQRLSSVPTTCPTSLLLSALALPHCYGMCCARCPYSRDPADEPRSCKAICGLYKTGHFPHPGTFTL